MIVPIRWLLSLVFIVQMYLAMAVMALVFRPGRWLAPRGAVTAAHTIAAGSDLPPACSAACAPRCAAPRPPARWWSPPSIKASSTSS
jgi:hypothetical protein